MRVILTKEGRFAGACSSSMEETMHENAQIAGHVGYSVVEMTGEEYAAFMAAEAERNKNLRPVDVRRAERYAAETDPLLTLIQARRLEGRDVEAGELLAEWLARREAIRAALPSV